MKRIKYGSRARQNLLGRKVHNFVIGDIPQSKKPYSFATTVMLNEGLSVSSVNSVSGKFVETSTEVKKNTTNMLYSSNGNAKESNFRSHITVEDISDVD